LIDVHGKVLLDIVLTYWLLPVSLENSSTQSDSKPKRQKVCLHNSNAN